MRVYRLDSHDAEDVFQEVFARAFERLDTLRDGDALRPWIAQTAASSRRTADPHDALYFYWGRELHAVRSGRWKLHLPHPYQSLESAGKDGSPGKYVRKQIELSLFDLDKDPGESTNVAHIHPDVVKKLMDYVERAREDLGDSLTNRTGKNVRAAGQLQ